MLKLNSIRHLILVLLWILLPLIAEGGWCAVCGQTTASTSKSISATVAKSDSTSLKTNNGGTVNSTLSGRTVAHRDSASQALVDSVAALNRKLEQEGKKTGKKSSSMIDAPVEYKAQDSLVFTANGIGYLYGQGEVVYKQRHPMQISADYIEFNSDSNTVFARGVVDSLGNEHGTPIFKDGSSEYGSKTMSYNFKTRKGYIRGGVTEEGEGYIIADKTKKTEDDQLFLQGGKYTTCSNHEHPHFYLQLTKAKVKPGGFLAAGPAYMVLEDVPLPIAVPFGFFPMTTKRSSGVIMPTFGDEMQRGLYLRDGGYYFAINDYVDLQLKGEIFTKGTWGVTLASNYKWRYHFSGDINISYREDVTGEKNLPTYSKNKNFKLSWRHTQDSKSSQYSTFSASVDFATSGYNKSNVNYYYNPIEQSKNITSSSVNYSQRFPDSQWSISLTASLSQRTADSTISLNFPSLTVTLGRIYPFKKKNRVGKEKFYEKISFSYNMNFTNSISCKESQLFHSSLAKDWNNKITHRPSIQASYTILKYITLTPTINYNSTMSFRKVEQEWDVEQQQVMRDTVPGFFYTQNFSGGISLSTKLYGFYTPNRKIFGNKIDRIRHVLTPSVNYSYSPDFGKPFWGMYKTYDKLIVDKNNINQFTRESVRYSPYIDAPGVGETNAISWTLDNNLEMKVIDKKASDTSSTIIYKKVSLIDKLSLSTGYNFAADSMNWSYLAVNLRLKLTKKFTLNLNGNFDPYMYELNANNMPVRVNKLRWSHGKSLYFMGTSTSFQYTFNNDTFKRKEKEKKQDTDNADLPPDEGSYLGDEIYGSGFDHDHDHETAEVVKDDEGYTKPEFKWSLSFNYSIALVVKSGLDNFDYQKMQYKRGINHSLSVNGYINPTPKWQLNYNASFDLTVKKITNLTMTIRRDLHCWYLNASVTPISYAAYGTSFMVTIGANASMLRDLKYDKRSDNSSNVNWF
ncbi:MAG: putative LPS assembly protein LptD [Bacteroidales bacterium]|nr:putative LPS assembly protein LptD [Bacteroidales bacterium]